MRRTTSSAIGIGSMGALSHADFAPWASGTSLPRQPRLQNGFAERLIGSIWRECVDHMIVLGEVHLRRILKSYAHYYNGVRTHRSLNKDWSGHLGADGIRPLDLPSAGCVASQIV
jgi:transposase InsO family protein